MDDIVATFDIKKHMASEDNAERANDSSVEREVLSSIQDYLKENGCIFDCKCKEEKCILSSLLFSCTILSVIREEVSNNVKS